MLTWLSVWSEVQICMWPANTTATRCQQNTDWINLSGTSSPG